MAKSKEFQEKEALIKLQQKVNEELHDMKMKELIYKRESDQLHHNHEKERQRIKSAEIRKMQERKELSRMGGRY